MTHPWRSLALAVAGLVLAAVMPAGASADRGIGGVDLDARCRDLDFERVVLEGPVYGPGAAYRWRCESGTTRVGIDVDAACRWEYARDDVYSRAVDPNDAFSWRCYRRPPPPSTVVQLSPINYRAFDGHYETLVPWQGEEVSVLSKNGVARDPDAMIRLVSALDRAYRFYTHVSGREPTPYSTLNGRDTIAQVSSTCGAGCGYLGYHGVEIADPFFEGMYRAVRDHDHYDQIPFYELGRNFYFFGQQLSFHSPDRDPVGSGQAVWMRFESMSAAVVEGDPALETFRGEVAALVDVYEADSSITFSQTLAQNRSPGRYNGTDFWASLMMRLANRYGGEDFIYRFWRKVLTLSPASTTAGAVANWERAASFAACADLSAVFFTRWGFPRANGSVSSRPAASSVPYPAKGSCAPLDSPNSNPSPSPGSGQTDRGSTRSPSSGAAGAVSTRKCRKGHNSKKRKCRKKT